jgi:hypothetical protein
MVSLTSLWLPIVVSAVAVFFVSFLLHMVLRYHVSDFAKLPGEEAIGDVIRAQNVPPGDYMMPHGGGPEAMKDPAFIAKVERGPTAVMTVMPSRKPTMGAELTGWFIYLVVISLVCAYVASRAVSADGAYLDVFRFAGTTAFVAHGLGQWPDSIWYKRKVSTSIKNTIDGLIYALVTAGIFGWLWPR